MPKLTKKLLDTLGPVKGRDVVAWDNELRGFGIRIKPTGASSYMLQYRNTEGRSRRLTLGSATVLTPEQARNIARERLVEVTRGGDPAEAKRILRAAPTVAEVCDWYVEKSQSGELLGRRRRPIARTTLALDRSRIETHVKPLIGNRLVRGLTVADLERFQADVTAGKTAKARVNRGGVTTGGAGVASRTIGMLHTIFEQAARLRLIAENPTRGVRKAAGSVKLERRLSLEEIAALGAALRAADEESLVALDAIRFTVLTGFRRMEVLALERSWVDAGASCVRFPTTKSGAQLRVIGAAAGKIFQAQPSVEENPYVFPSDLSGGHFVGVVRVLQRICENAKLAGVTPHVLRHTFASVAGDLGFSEMTIAALLGHAARGVTQRYVHLDQALLLAADKISEQIAEALSAHGAASSFASHRRRA